MFCIVCRKIKYPVFLLYNKNYCINHAKLYYNNYIIRIQKIYRGYKLRKYINNIFFKLPRDIQIHIINFNKINHKKYTEFIKKKIYKYNYKINNFVNINKYEIYLFELNNILNNLILYYNIIDTKWINYYKFYFNNIHYILSILTYNVVLPSNINLTIYESLNLYPNLINNNFNKEASIIINKILVFNSKIFY